MTDQEIITLLAKREGFKWEAWTQNLEGTRQWALRKGDVTREFRFAICEPIIASAINIPAYLTSRDALSPIIAGLNEEEKVVLAEMLKRRFSTRKNANCLYVPWLLNMRARDLAEAIAEVIGKSEKPVN